LTRITFWLHNPANVCC